MINLPTKLSLVGVSALLGLFVADQGLRLAGVATELPGTFAHPPGLSELRTNLEFHYSFATNSQGLRYREIPLQKPAGTYRVIVLGDSYTEGWGVNAADTYAARLERCYAGKDHDVLFVNGGLSGVGPLEYGRLLFRVGMQYQLDGVLLSIFANDVTDTPMSASRNDLKAAPRDRVNWLAHALWPRIHTVVKRVKEQHDNRRYRATSFHRIQLMPGHLEAPAASPSPGRFVAVVSDHAAGLGIPQAQIEAWRRRLPPSLVVATNNGEFNGAILSTGLLHPAYWTDNLDMGSDSANAKWSSMSAILSAIVEEVRTRGLAIGVVFIPSPVQYSKDNQDLWARVGVTVRTAWLSEESEFQKRLRTWAEVQAVPFLDLTPTFRSAAKPGANVFYPFDGHWTASGHRVASEAIGNWLMNESVFPFLTR